MTEDISENRRQYFRLVYPIGEELRIELFENTRGAVVGKQVPMEFRVDEISEMTLRVIQIIEPVKRYHCRGRIFWADNLQTNFEGRLGPVRGSKQVITAINGITFSDLIREQRRILSKYPAAKESPWS